MVYLIWKIHSKFYNMVKGVKFKNAKSNFHLFLLFEQGSPIGLL
jgi:hypothetical protein